MKKAIGILGGMGPLATADLFAKIVRMTRASCDNEHIRIYIDNNARIPDRTAAILRGGADPVPEMMESLRKLEACGADCIIMPCNTAHYFLPVLQEQTKIPFISMLDETARACAARYPGKRAGILATRGTLESGLYTRALGLRGVDSMKPDEEGRAALMAAIYDGVKGGCDLETLRAPLESLLTRMAAQGADYFILGCTELPIVQQQLDLPGIFVDPTVELAKAAIRFCGYEVRE